MLLLAQIAALGILLPPEKKISHCSRLSQVRSRAQCRHLLEMCLTPRMRCPCRSPYRGIPLVERGPEPSYRLAQGLTPRDPFSDNFTTRNLLRTIHAESEGRSLKYMSLYTCACVLVYMRGVTMPSSPWFLPPSPTLARQNAVSFADMIIELLEFYSHIHFRG